MELRAAAAVFVALAAAGTLACCSRPAQRDLATAPPPPAVPAGPAAAAGTPADHLHDRLHRVSPGIFSGAQPDSDAEFDRIAGMGVRTILSVDGGKPDVERARARGMRYVHLPVGYDGITPQRQAEIARAVRDLPGPVYIHCHHGLHRGPAAAASAAVLLGDLSVDGALRLLETAGTSPSYPGLWSCVREAGTLPRDAVERASAAFPEVAPVPGFVEAMVDIDAAYEHLKLIGAAGWRTPDGHPDLVPAAEAGRMADLLRDLKHDGRAKGEGGEFLFFLLTNAEHARSLEGAIVAGAERGALDERLKAVGTSCRDCHVRFRN